MTLPTEAVTLAGSGLTFINTYDATVTAAYRTAVITAENVLQAHFTNQLTVSVDFSYSALGSGVSASNNFSEVNVSYSALQSALAAHATTSDDHLAVANLPALDPSGGKGFALPTAYAIMLGLTPQTNGVDDNVTLNSTLGFTFGQDAVGAIEHELTEGVFGRTSSLGFAETRWNPLDLFRFTASGVRDFTGGSDGVTTFFGIAPTNVSSLAFHSSVGATGRFDGQDLGDWASSVVGDAFGAGGPGSPGTVSTTDLQVLDVLGWNPATSVAFVPAADDFANSLADAAHPFGHLNVGGSATGALQQAGDHDWFAVNLQAGVSYAITETGHSGGGGFQDIVLGNLGNDTLVAGSQANVLRGGQGDDVITGGAGNDFISGDLGNDTETGGAGADIFHGSPNVGVDQINDFSYAQGDRVELDPGTTYTLSQIGANTVIQMSTGGEMILMNTTLANLPSDWIFEGTLSHL